MINIEEPGGSERGGHVYMFWANHLGHPEMSPMATLRVSFPDPSRTLLAMWTRQLF